MATRMLQRRGTAAEWAALNPVLSNGEIGFETDTKVMKMGDGVTVWNELHMSWVPAGGGSMTGPLSLVEPTQNAHAVRKLDLDSAVQNIEDSFPAGIVAFWEHTTTITVTATQQTIIDESLTLPSGRLLRVTAQATYRGASVGGGGLELQPRVDGSVLRTAVGPASRSTSSTEYMTVSVWELTTSTGASMSFELRVTTRGDNVSLRSGNYPTRLLVEDLGPAS